MTHKHFSGFRCICVLVYLFCFFSRLKLIIIGSTRRANLKLVQELCVITKNCVFGLSRTFFLSLLLDTQKQNNRLKIEPNPKKERFYKTQHDRQSHDFFFNFSKTIRNSPDLNVNFMIFADFVVPKFGVLQIGR